MVFVEARIAGRFLRGKRVIETAVVRQDCHDASWVVDSGEIMVPP